MTEEFIRKRIREQCQYIGEVSVSKLNKKRKLEIIKSAFGQLKYFADKLK